MQETISIGAKPFMECGLTAGITDLLEFKKLKHLEQQAKQQKAIKEAGEPTSNFFRVSHLTIKHQIFKDLSAYGQALYFILCSHRNRYQRGKAYFTRSLRQLSKDTGWAVNTVRKAQKELIAQRFIICVSKPGGRTRYQILDVRSGKSLL